jgi:pyridinium-3,5-bisthiocarboxylic acid mononucleotide nickel chelatase
MNAGAQAGEGELLFIEPHSGMAGDMFLAALLNLEDPRFTLEDLRSLVEALVPGECRLATETVWRGSLSGLQLTVHTGEEGASAHRHLSDVQALVARAPLSAAARARASAVFRRIAVAEAHVHGTTVEEIHFHEVGAVDALVDVCGAALALERLGIARILATPPVTGTGTVRCAHGLMPVPVPAVVEILRGLPHVLGGGSGERLTPTGAALLAECVAEFVPPGAFVVRAVGYGAGHRDPPDGAPNILRVQLGRAGPATERSEVWQLDVNLDDMSGEELGFLVGALRTQGALEVWTSSVHMKKDRPGTLVSLLCRAEARDGLEQVVFAHSTSLGVRWTRCERREARRETLDVEIAGQKVRVVRRYRPGVAGATLLEGDLSPEYDDLARLAHSSGLPLRDLERAAVEAALRALGG